MCSQETTLAVTLNAKHSHHSTHLDENACCRWKKRSLMLHHIICSYLLTQMHTWFLRCECSRTILWAVRTTVETILSCTSTCSPPWAVRTACSLHPGVACFHSYMMTLSLHADTTLSSWNNGSMSPFQYHVCLSRCMSVLYPLTSRVLNFCVSSSHCVRASANASIENCTAKTR